MREELMEKRAEYLDEIAECEKDLETARQRLEWLDELIADFAEDAEEDVIETADAEMVAMDL